MRNIQACLLAVTICKVALTSPSTYLINNAVNLPLLVRLVAKLPEFKKRYLCHCKALKGAGLEVNSSMQFDAISTEQSGYQAAQNLIDTGNIFNAVFCASDLIALGALRCLREKELNIPQDVAIAGFDNIPISSFANPALTTVHQNTKLAGEILVNSLLKLINGEKVSHYLMPVDLVVRQSCGTLT